MISRANATHQEVHLGRRFGFLSLGQFRHPRERQDKERVLSRAVEHPQVGHERDRRREEPFRLVVRRPELREGLGGQVGGFREVHDVVQGLSFLSNGSSAFTRPEVVQGKRLTLTGLSLFFGARGFLGWDGAADGNGLTTSAA